MISYTIAALAFTGLVAAQGVVINTPSLTECQPAAISYSGGTPPYFIIVLPAATAPNGVALEQFPSQAAAGTYTWSPVNLPSGTNVTLGIRDGTGALNYAAPVVIAAGTSDACLTATTTSGAGASSTPPAVGASTTTSAAGTTTSAAATTQSSSAATTSGSSSSTTTSGSAPAATTSAPASGAGSLSSGFSVIAGGVAAYLVSSLLM